MPEQLERLTVYVETALFKKVVAESERLDRSQSWVVHRILEKHYAQQETAQT